MGPRFESPPVVERILGVQFAELQFFTDAHVGWFWKSFLEDREGWTRITTAPKIQEKFERFGKPLHSGDARFQIRQGPSPERSQIVRESDERMLQIQNTRLHLNWRKKEGLDYPEYEDLIAEYLGLLDRFKSFVQSATDEELKINQWEITYLNQIPRGELWSSAGDWMTLFPGLSLPGYVHGVSDQLQTMGCKWSLNLPEESGRLHIKLSHAYSGLGEETEIVLLDLTARGPVNDTKSFKDGLNTGHDSIVNMFKAITSVDAHKKWGLKDDN